MTRWTRDVALPLVLALVVAVLLGPPPAAAQSAPPPDGDWRTFRTEHVRVTYTPELEPLARQAGAIAERAYRVLADELMEPPDRMIDLVVTDHVDYANGYAGPFPSPRTVVFARPPVGTPSLAYNRSWLEQVVTHELVHIFHLEETGAVGSLVRTVLGRVPTLWPVFPVVGTPNWSVEGLATHYETRITGTGRVAGSYHDMMLRTAVLEAELPALDEVSAPHPGWPGGDRSYAYGSRFMRYIADRWGAEAHREIIEATGASLLPTFLFFDPVAERALDAPFDAVYDDWRRHVADSVRAFAAEVRAAGLTETEWVAGAGPWAEAPRVSPDGGRLTFASHDYRADPGTRLVDLGTGEVRVLARRNQFGARLGPAAWLPDGRSLVFAQLERQGRFRAYSDLWRLDLDGRERRLTHGARLTQPDVAPDGRRVAAVQSHRGGIRMVIHDLETGGTRVLAEAAPGDAFDSPRWSPDGRRIAAGRFTDGRVDLVTVDVATGAVTRHTDDDALDLEPAWSPDGHWLLWWSDRTGIPNILAVAVDRPGAAPLQVTRVLTGAFDPEVAPDGRTIYLSAYHHDGWRIERLPFDPGSWTPAGDAVRIRAPGLIPAPAPVGELGWQRGTAAAVEPEAAAAAVAESSAYSPWPTLRPYFWLPTWERSGSGDQTHDFLGIRTSGEDLLGRHFWQAALAVDPGTGRVRGGGAWTYRGLGNPDLRVAGSREWSALGAIDLDPGRETIFERSDELAADAIFWWSRWRRTAWLRVGAEAEWRELVPYELSRDDLDEREITLGDPPTVAGLSASPGFTNARSHPYSISPQDGISGSIGVGRWWNVTDGAHAYDELVGRLSGYLGFPLWGFADHVLAVRAAGLVRDGDRAFTRSIGGVPGSLSGIPASARDLFGGTFGSSFFPVRGFDEGVRRGTRAWTVSAEYRFPLHLIAAPGAGSAAGSAGILGFSLTSLAGSLFADAGDAWCGDDTRGRFQRGCGNADARPLLSVGAELAVDFGALHNLPAFLRGGVARPLVGRPEPLDPSVYLAWGIAF